MWRFKTTGQETGAHHEIYLNSYPYSNTWGIYDGLNWYWVIPWSQRSLIWDGNWHFIQFEIGLTTNVLRLWVDEALIYENTSLPWNAEGALLDIFHFSIGNTLTHAGDWQAGWEYMEFDDVIISTHYVDIGVSDTTPDAFSFTDVTEATQSTVYTSNVITVTGIDDLTPIPITVVGNSAEFQKNGVGGWFTSGTVILNDTVTIRQTSSPTVNTAVNTVVTIGGVADSGSPWTVTTGIFGIPNLITPTSGSTDVTRPVTFTWSLVAGKTVYNIQIDDAVDFVTPVIDVDVLTNSYTATTLLPSTQYWWRVRAR
jgi:hypothetical protein